MGVYIIFNIIAPMPEMVVVEPYAQLRFINPIQTGRWCGGGGGGAGWGRGWLLRPAPTLKKSNFQNVKAMTTKTGDFS